MQVKRIFHMANYAIHLEIIFFVAEPYCPKNHLGLIYPEFQRILLIRHAQDSQTPFPPIFKRVRMAV
jgi:hypothetical protein